MNKIPLIDKRSLLALLSVFVIVFLAACGNSSSASGDLKQIRLDYAYYSPAYGSVHYKPQAASGEEGAGA
ncbi:hypothetical protein RSW78_25625, partial [Escherichia coli]